MRLRSLYRYIIGLILTITVVPNGYGQTTDQEVKAMLRAIGHEFLLQIDDSTSRILPIEQVEERYAVRFENEFAFDPGILVSSTYQTFEDFKIEETYIVEVEQCETKEVVHSFTTNFGR